MPIKTITRATEKGAHVWRTEGAVTHAHHSEHNRTYCDLYIEGFDQGWVPGIFRQPDCPRCLVYFAYLNLGFGIEDTGGGCTAFYMIDPVWTPPTKHIILPAERGTPRLPITIGIEYGTAIQISWEQLMYLSNRAQSIFSAHPTPYIRVTDESNVPDSLDVPISVGYYEGKEDEVAAFLFELPDSASFFRALAEAKGGVPWYDALLGEDGTALKFD